MTTILISDVVGLMSTLLGAPPLIRYLHVKEYGQSTRQDGPQGHFTKHGAPTMDGLVIIISTALGYTLANLSQLRTPHASGILLFFLVVGPGLIRFLDDLERVSKQRSPGLRAWQKIAGQVLIGIGFSVTALHFTDYNGLTPVSARISFAWDSAINLAFVSSVVGLILFVLWASFLITAWSNAVNLTDGFDGLAAGASVMVFGVYTFISVRQINQSCNYSHGTIVPITRHQVRDPRDLAVIAVALARACLGFLQWSASPAKIFTGNTGPLALGGAAVDLPIPTRAEFLAVTLDGLFLTEVMSDIIQIVSFKSIGRRVFHMAPLHHHFELGGWIEVNAVIRFWVIAGLCVITGLGIFYVKYLRRFIFG